MTTLKEKLQADRTAAYKNGNTLAKDTLGLVIGGIQTAEKAGKVAKEFTDAEVQKFLTTEVKKRRETAKNYADAGVNDSADRETAEADFLATYLPVQLSEAEIRVVVEGVIASNPTAATNQVMGLVMKQLAGKADGALVRSIVQEATQN